ARRRLSTQVRQVPSRVAASLRSRRLERLLRRWPGVRCCYEAGRLAERRLVVRLSPPSVLNIGRASPPVRPVTVPPIRSTFAVQQRQGGEEDPMFRFLRFVTALAAGAAVLAFGGAAQGGDAPLWIQHVQNYDGGISNGVRSRLEAPAVQSSGFVSAQPATLSNVQMNADSTPPLPQNETSVALKPSSPRTAVAAANDYTGHG